MKIALLYICTGKYDVFWDGFYESSEQFFLTDSQKEYFVFTDQEIEVSNDRVHKIFQNKLGWPYDTLMRFKMFYEIKDQLKTFDYIFFVNANMRFVVPIKEEILPNKEERLLVVKHPGFYNKDRSEFTYDENPESLAFIPANKGQYYFMGGFNGGVSSAYLELIATLKSNIDTDLDNDIVAVWHDESHLNNYMLERNAKILDPSYGYPEGWDGPFEKKIIILDKTKFGGHNSLREVTEINKSLSFIQRIKVWWSK